MAQATIAVVNNDTAFLELMGELLGGEGYRTLICKEGDKAYELVKERQPDLVVLDVRLDHPESGWTILELLRLDPATARIPVIVCSADIHCLHEQTARLEQQGYRLMEKPLQLDALLASIDALLAPSCNERGR